MKVIEETWRIEFARGVLLVSGTVVGIVLPVDFLAQVDGYLMYLRPQELLSSWGWAWLLYLFLGSVTSFIALTLSAAASAALPSKPIVLTIRFGSLWLAISAATLTLVRCGKLWLAAHNFIETALWLTENQLLVTAISLIAIAVLIWKSDKRHNSFKSLAKLGSAVGLLVALVSLVTSLIVPSKRSEAQRAESITSEGRPPPSRPDIILITIDALAANHLSVYDYNLPTSPNLVQLAKEANVFERFYANGNATTSTTNSFLSGVRPWTHRANQGFANVNSSISDRGLVARLKLSGYQTFAVSTNGYAAPFLNGTHAWFDQVSYGNTHEINCILFSTLTARFPDTIPLLSLGLFAKGCSILEQALVYFRFWSPTNQFDPELALSSAKQLLEARRHDQPTFLWIHLFPPHSPYAAPEPFLGRFNPRYSMRTRFDSSPPVLFAAKLDEKFPEVYSGRYDEAICYVDNSLGSFFSWLKHHELYDDTLLLVSADHGESFSHSYGTHGGPMLYEDVIHIPLLLKAPRQTVGNRQSALAEQVDLMPTILSYASIPVSESIEGKSLRPSLNGETRQTPIFTMWLEKNSRFDKLAIGTIAMLEGDWKYTHYFGHFDYPLMPKLVDILCNLKTDSSESINLVAKEPAIAERMRAAIQEKLRRQNGFAP